MKLKTFFIVTTITVTTTIIITLMLIAIESIFNINITLKEFIIGWMSASTYYITIKKINSKNITSIKQERNNNDVYNPKISTNSELIDCINELEYFKSRYENLKSETIVKDNIKIN